jgi:hypothetical protein
MSAKPAGKWMTRLSGLGGKRKDLPYVPGAPVKRSRCAAGGNTKVLRRRTEASPVLPSDVMDKILSILVEKRAAAAVMMLSMVNKNLHASIVGDRKLWYQLYLHWRGPTVFYREGGKGIVRLMPSTPRTVPNFRLKGLSLP